jgi:hypothetical protein
VLNIVVDAHINITIGFVQTLDIRLNQVAFFALVGLFLLIGAQRLHVSDFISYIVLLSQPALRIAHNRSPPNSSSS